MTMSGIENEKIIQYRKFITCVLNHYMGSTTAQPSISRQVVCQSWDKKIIAWSCPHSAQPFHSLGTVYERAFGATCCTPRDHRIVIVGPCYQKCRVVLLFISHINVVALHTCSSRLGVCLVPRSSAVCVFYHQLIVVSLTHFQQPTSVRAPVGMRQAIRFQN
jgi:hypothetical protein